MTPKYKTIYLQVHESVEQLNRLIGKEKHLTVRKALQILHAYASGQAVSKAQIARLVGANWRTVDDVFKRYALSGIEGLTGRRHKGRPKGKLLVVSEAVIEIVRTELADPKNNFNSYIDFQKRLVELSGKDVNYKTAYRIARFHLKAKLKKPRPSNLKKDVALEEVIKKKMPLLARLMLRNLIPELSRLNLAGLEIWCMDEMRLGLRADPGLRLTLKGVKPLGLHLNRYISNYLFGGVNIASGESEFMEADACNGDFFQHFLWQISNNNPLMLKVVILDNGGFHKRKDLVVPPNVKLLFLPPYTPELNPMERLWQEVRRVLKGKVFETMGHLNDAVRTFLADWPQAQIRQTAGFACYRNVIKSCQDIVSIC